MRDLLATWSGEFVTTRYDHPTGTWMFIAVHSLALGPAMGGCRMHVYDAPEAALRDAMRLAEGMTYKWATIEFSFGGGKSVLAVPRRLVGAERVALLRRYGELVNTLGGRYSCGPDLGTTPEDMTVIGEVTPYVHGAGRDGHPPIDPGPYTALGVSSGMRAALRHVTGKPDLAGRTVLIQGVGDVGAPLARLVAAAGGRLLLADLDAERARSMAAELGAEVVSPDAVFDTPCDIYAPCAVGAVLNRHTIPRLRCRIVAGSANNQLDTPADADRLQARGILYAPDYVINAGGATALPLLEQGADPGSVRERISGFEQILGAIFDEARERDESPAYAAKRRAERVLAQGRASAELRSRA